MLALAAILPIAVAESPLAITSAKPDPEGMEELKLLRPYAPNECVRFQREFCSPRSRSFLRLSEVDSLLNSKSFFFLDGCGKLLSFWGSGRAEFVFFKLWSARTSLADLVN